MLGAVASSAFGPAHCCKVVACCQWTSGTQDPARLAELSLTLHTGITEDGELQLQAGLLFLCPDVELT